MLGQRRAVNSSVEGLHPGRVRTDRLGPGGPCVSGVEVIGDRNASSTARDGALAVTLRAALTAVCRESGSVETRIRSAPSVKSSFHYHSICRSVAFQVWRGCPCEGGRRERA